MNKKAIFEGNYIRAIENMSFTILPKNWIMYNIFMALPFTKWSCHISEEFIEKDKSKCKIELTTGKIIFN